MLSRLRHGGAGLPCLLAACAQQRCRKTWAQAGDCDDEAKRERRRQRRQTTLRLKEWVATQEPAWFVSTAARQLKQRSAKEGLSFDDEEETDAKFWEWLLKSARSRKEHQRLHRAWRQWQKANSQQQEQSRGFGSFWEEQEEAWRQQQEAWRERKKASSSSSFNWRDMWGTQAGGGGSGAGYQWQEDPFGKQQQQQQWQRRQPPPPGSSNAVRNSMAALGLREGTVLSAEVLKEAFRRSALCWHPDRHPVEGRPQAELRFKDAQAAFHLLLSMVAP